MFSTLLLTAGLASLAQASALAGHSARDSHHANIAARQSVTSQTSSLAATPAASSATSAAPQGTAPAAGAPSATITYQSGKPTLTVQTYTPGSTPSSIPGAPGLPQPFVYVATEWPTPNVVPPTDSDEVKTWMKELEGFDIPNLSPTLGDCQGDPAAAAESAKRGWWTCTGTTRDTDIVACPDKNVWGLTFDDGPGPYTPTLLKFLNEKKISATFYVVGGRVLEHPNTLIEEYMTGHEISVHTWSHSKPLTSLTNEQIVAELGWTRKAIKQVLGVSPITMRPPWGDIDDRVRAISMAMGMIPVMWTRMDTPTGPIAFDTNDWMVAGNEATADQSVATFNSILGNATNLNTGFITLEHDIHEVTVDLAMGNTIPAALGHNPPFKVQAVGVCMHLPPTDLYRETTKNTTFPYPQNDAAVSVEGDPTASKSNASASGNAKQGNGASSNFASPFFVLSTIASAAALASLL
ncbi:hypothetical protein DL96DRAFT_835181 [Flagelloscypha sp. PMI_526]|nr:hypothetical protein DL96DRAFT_835181 [Flagelloscypha sp. PMI_526]